MLRPITLVLILIPCLAIGQGLRSGDRPLDVGELATRLAGSAVTFYDGSRAHYGAEGAYGYRYTPEDPEFSGRYRTAGDGEVCVVFENGLDRCDTYVEADGRLVLITADGLRFPVRSHEPVDR